MKLRLMKATLAVITIFALCLTILAQQSDQNRSDTGTTNNQNSGSTTSSDKQNKSKSTSTTSDSQNRGNSGTNTTQAGASSGAASNTNFTPDLKSKDAKEAAEQSSKAARVINDMMDKPDNNIPEWLFDKAECVAVFPSVVKAAFIVGGRGGKGVVTCRDPQTREWMQPMFLKVGGGSFGAQIGIQSTDLLLFGMNRDSMDAFTKDRLELGGEASVAAGPVGRQASASTDAPTFSSQFLSYSRNKGLFAGVALQGAVIDQDNDLNRAIYGPDYTAAGTMKSARTVPNEISAFTRAVQKFTTPKK